MEYRVNPRSVFIYLAGTSAVLTVLGVGALANWHLEGIRNGYTKLLVTFFDLSTESSVPTWFSSTILLIAALVLLHVYGIKAVVKDSYRYYWLGLSILFFALSVDEVAMIHERLGASLASQVVGATSGLFYYSWTVAGIAFVILVGIVYLRFLWSLPVRTRWLFVAAGSLFVGGAIGVEMINGLYSETHGSWNLMYAIGTAVEELLEMLGVCLFIYALLDYIRPRSVGSGSQSLDAGHRLSVELAGVPDRSPTRRST